MKKFFRDTSGNFAIITGIIAIPIFAMAGGALDYTFIYNKRADTQNGLDAAILYVGTRMSEFTDDQLKEEFQKSLESNLSADQLSSITSTEFNIDRTSGSFYARLNSGYPTSILRVVGMNTLEYTVESQIRVGSLGGAEVIMALDTTLSMQTDNKIGALKTAATNFSTSLLGNNTVNDKVKIGIVPFGRYVNVGLDNRNASWLDVEDDSSQEQCSMQAPEISSSGCTSIDVEVDGIVSHTYNQCTNITYGEPVNTCETVNTIWHGCVGSRDEPLNVRDTDYFNNKIPGLMNHSCGNPILPLTTNKTDILQAISALTPAGDTYMASGITWGFRAITDGEPFSQGVNAQEAQDKNTRKILVLMSDGENTQAPSPNNFTFHNSTDKEKADEFTLQACAEAKANDVTIYTIGFGDEITADTEQLLLSCASQSENYLSASNAQELQIAFDKVSNEINTVYLSR